MLKEGDIAIWQNVDDYDGRHLNGTECTVVIGLHYVNCVNAIGQTKEILCYKTDTLMYMPLIGREKPLVALPHQLRPKFPPKDEIDITEESPIVEHA